MNCTYFELTHQKCFIVEPKFIKKKVDLEVINIKRFINCVFQSDM